MTGPAPTAASTVRLVQLAEFLERAREAAELDERLELPGADGNEQRVVDALNAFLDKLWMGSFDLAAKQEMLERVIEIRTDEVHEILDNVNAGFLLTRADETILDNFSKSCVDIFGRGDLAGHRLSELMGLEGRARDTFQLFYEQVFEGMMPPEVCLWQLPKEFARDGRTFTLRGAPILDRRGQLTKVFFTITDATELRKLEAENALRKALIEIVRERDGFRALLEDTAASFQAAREAPTQARLRNVLHTAKGNLGCYGLHDIAAVIHSIEDADQIVVPQVDHVEELIKRFLDAQHAIIGLTYPRPGAPDAGAAARLRPLLEAIVAEPDPARRAAAAEDVLHKLAWVPVHGLLAPLRGLVDRVAARLGKQVELEITGDDVLVDPRRAGSAFANLGHLVRNALDHGLEPPDERGAKGPMGHLAIRCHETPAAWHVEVADDGRGIDADRVVAAAMARGQLGAADAAALDPAGRLRLIFLDGVTTREQATMESGRGVGMAALRAAVEEAHGTIAIASTPGAGTTFAITLPKA